MRYALEVGRLGWIAALELGKKVLRGLHFNEQPPRVESPRVGNNACMRLLSEQQTCVLRFLALRLLRTPMGAHVACCLDTLTQV